MENQKEVEFDLMQMFRHLLRRIWIVLLATAIAAGAGYIYTSKNTVPTYTADCLVFVYQNSYGTGNGTTTGTPALSYNDFVISMWLTNDCEAVLSSRMVTSQVVDALELNVDPDAIGKNIVVTSQEESRALKLSYKDTNPERAAAILNKLCEVAAPEIKTTLKITEFTQLDQAEVPTTPSKTNIARDTILAAAIGFVLSAAVLIVLFLLDDTIRNEDDVDRFLGLSTLTTIPISVDLSTDGKVSSKRKKKSQVWLKRK